MYEDSTTRCSGSRAEYAPPPGCRSVIDWATSCGYRIAIATDPFFPPGELSSPALAGFEPERFELVSG